MAGRNFHKRRKTVKAPVVPVSFLITPQPHQEWRIELFSRRYDIIQWCNETYSQPGHNRKYRWRIKYDSHLPDTIFLRNESDVAMFRLRWM